jgi:hypothetical protein
MTANERGTQRSHGVAFSGLLSWVEVWSVAGEWLDPVLDVSILLRYAELHDERAAYRMIVEREGRMAEGSLGPPKLHPAVGEIGAIDEWLRAAREARLGGGSRI